MNGGGLTYGYAPVAGKKGKRRIVDDDAEIVRRIFAEYVGGRTPRAIAGGLNREGVKPPRGKRWNASTINGNSARGNGILRNALYAGRLVWNKVRMIKDPDTGRPVSRPNPPEEWLSADVPELAILSRDAFDAAQARKKRRAVGQPAQQRRPRHMLSGLLRCASCGSGMSTNGKDRSGRVRVRCSAASESGACPDPKTFYLDTVEGAVLAGLKAELRHPKVLADYVRTYHDERKRLAADAIKTRGRIERRIGDTEAAKALRDLVETVTMKRDTSRPGGVEIKIAGRLNDLLGPRAFPNKVRGVWGAMVAEDRYIRRPHKGVIRYFLRACA